MKMIYGVVAVLTLAACGGNQTKTEANEAFALAQALPACDVANMEREVAHSLDGTACKLDLGDGRIAHVLPAPVPDSPEGDGKVDITIFNNDGAVLQSFGEGEVSSYLPITARIEDFDRDGAGDIRVTLNSGNVNTRSAIWAAREGAFVRLGEVNAVSTSPTADGFIALSTRESAATYSVAFVRVVADAITPIASFNLTPIADDKGAIARTECELAQAPGIAALGLTPEAATKKFCADPAAQIE
jgi:hypothetical protein